MKRRILVALVIVIALLMQTTSGLAFNWDRFDFDAINDPNWQLPPEQLQPFDEAKPYKIRKDLSYYGRDDLPMYIVTYNLVTEGTPALTGGVMFCYDPREIKVPFKWEMHRRNMSATNALDQLLTGPELTGGADLAVTSDVVLLLKATGPYTNYLIGTLFFVVRGDINCTGKIDISQVTSWLRVFRGGAVGRYEELAADINEDGKLDIADLVMLARALH